MPGCDGTGMAERSYPASEVRGSSWESHPMCKVGGTAERRHPMTEARVGSQEEPHHIQGVVAAWAQEGL